MKSYEILISMKSYEMGNISYGKYISMNSYENQSFHCKSDWCCPVMQDVLSGVKNFVATTATI